ncbi:MAG TPA: hypothetical protein VEC93_02265 [Anaerolineae bacterium]|nr:hypothetical protein [Anaerolineae bacterium]
MAEAVTTPEEEDADWPVFTVDEGQKKRHRNTSPQKNLPFDAGPVLC